MEKYGRIDVLLTMQELCQRRSVLKHQKENGYITDIIMGVLNGIMAVLPIMVEQKSGRLLH